MGLRTKLGWSAVAAGLAVVQAPAWGLGLVGSVQTPDGKPVAGAMVTVRSASAPAAVTKVFTGTDGRYRVPDLGAQVYLNSLHADAGKLGYEATEPAVQALGKTRPEVREGMAQVDFVLTPTDNIAAQVPASAWIHAMGESELRNDLVNVCTQCHQFPNEQVKAFAGNLGALDVAQREQVWRAMFQTMRMKFYGVLQAENADHPEPEAIAALAKPENSFINVEDENLLAPWLAAKFPTDFTTYPAAAAADWRAPMGVNTRTVIRQYPYDAKSFVRETAVVDGRVWVVDIARNRLGTLDAATGAYHWYDVPSAGAPAPHSMVPDDKGNLWVTLLEPAGKAVARLNPMTGEWKIFGGFPQGVVAHDQSPGPGFRIRFDKQGYSWLTLITHNQVIGFNPETGDVTQPYDLPMPDGETPFHISVYGGGMTPDGHYWFAQNNGGLGRFNTETREVDHYVEYERGTGPHRMIVTEDGTLYAGLIGSGRIHAYDTKALKEIKVIDLPDTAASLYSLIWDPVRNALWSGVVNTDRLFKYDIATGKFTEYPTGIKDLHVRIGAVDPDTGALWVASSPIPSENDPEVRWIFSLDPGDRPAGLARAEVP